VYGLTGDAKSAEALDGSLELRENMPSSDAGRWLAFEVAGERPWTESRWRVER
jgi:hypothetical protein